MIDADDRQVMGRLLRRAAPPKEAEGVGRIRIDDARLRDVLAEDARLLVLYEGTLHGEGPVWHEADGCLYWSDVPNRRLLRWQPDGEVTVAIDGTFFMNGNAIDDDGHLVHCEHGRRCISRSATLGDERPFVTHYGDKRLNTPNDIAVAADGTIWFTDPTFGLLMPSQGSLREPELDHRSVYRFDPEADELRRMADFDQPNGLAFSPDGRTLYVSDTALSLDEIPGPETGTTHEILAFEVGDDATLTNRRLFHRTAHGYPDGFAVDRRGWVWTTAADGIHVVASDGTVLGAILTPAVAANCAFGGPGNTRLFIAATQYLLAVDLAPSAGR